jgi:hypothetical protein
MKRISFVSADCAYVAIRKCLKQVMGALKRCFIMPSATLIHQRSTLFQHT